MSSTTPREPRVLPLPATAALQSRWSAAYLRASHPETLVEVSVTRDDEGGYLRVHGDRGVRDVNTRNRWVRFDGRYVHEVLPYTGTRYSVVYFQLVPPFDVDPSSTEEGQ